jgi:hypothetical protein
MQSTSYEIKKPAAKVNKVPVGTSGRRPMSAHNAMSSTEPVSSTLLPEILGFHPQLLLDDIINAANEPIYQCTEFVSAFMVGWASERKQKPETSSKEDQEEISKEIEQVWIDPGVGV